MADIIIGGTIHSSATGNVVARADEILDNEQHKKQNEINAELINAVGLGGSVDSKIAAAKSEIRGNASPACDTLGEAEAKINANTSAINTERTRAEGVEAILNEKITAEKSRAEAIEIVLDGRVDVLEEAVGTGGSVDARIANAVNTEKTRAENAEELLRRAYEAITRSKPEIVADHTEVAEPEENTIYREFGESSYSDWMYYNEQWYKMATYDNAIDDEPTPNSDNLVKSGGVYNELAIAGVYDVTAHNSNATFASLSALLSDANLNTLIPTAVRKGGMSIKFVQSSDNKYVQYRLMADEWSTDTDDWAFCVDNVLVENPEWIYVLLDSQKRILAGLKPDGSVEWSIGVPTPVKTYIANAIAEIKNGTEGTDLDGLNKIITFLREFSTSDTLKDLLDEKVDKEEGKSLIDSEYAKNISYIENTEWISVETDNEGKIIKAIDNKGIEHFFVGLNVVGNEVTVVENPEFVKITVDNDNKIIEAIKKDGTKVVQKLDAINIGENLQGLIAEYGTTSRWKNKNIAYFGTSVPAQGYPQKVGIILKANVYNMAVGSSMMRCGIPTTDYINHNELGDDLGLGGIYFGNIMRSMSRTQKELRYIFDNWTDDRRKANLIAKGYSLEQVANVKGYSYYIGGSFPEEQTDPSTPQGWPTSKPVDVYAGDGETYKTFRQLAYSCCWDDSEGIESDLSMTGALTGTIQGRMQKFINGEIDTDLFVFDHFRNDAIDSTTSQYLEIPQNPIDRNYAEGAFNYLVQQILMVKPNAQIVIIGHIDNDDTKVQLGHVWEAQEEAANEWGFPLLKLWEKLGIRCWQWVTTTGYWDSNGVWHESGYNGSNHVWHSNNGATAAQYEDPRQIEINGVLTWVHSLTTRMIWLKDDIHPSGSLALNHFASAISAWLNTI